MRRSSLALLLLLSAACAHGPKGRSGPNVLITPAELALQTGLEPWAISMPFGKDQDGTELVLQFMERAEASGAHFVSDVQVVFMAEENGQPLECRTRLVPEGTARDIQRGMRTAESGSRSPALTLVQRPVSRPEYTCMSQQGARVATGTYVDTGVERGLVPSRGQGGGRGLLNAVTLCGYQPVTRMLTRYAFEDTVNYVPPQLPRVREARPELRIEETDAECLPREPHAPAVNRIEAIAYGGSGPKAALGSSPEVIPVQHDL
ncbi:hypothetical protein HPC49_48280 [Pyxidicoccus fallax]|uniref:Lipoprotein n=1 Tax=Pyxidicoccus fallax TaxID=394095 RepID=A0A848LPS2_9BACT|nr:hypothetical protein [Pyxidicoccus fallax]NMO19494.1 hypothetical protein [Pyxidicoccus fallax]NPC85970.1 hypothetical protein [Pyxidicoccus fallax]